MLTICFPTSFLDISTSTSSLGCKASCLVISFRVLWFICLVSYLFNFKNGPRYFTSRTVEVIISFITFLLYSLVSFFLWYHLSFFLSSPLVWWPLIIFPIVCKFPFFQAFRFVSLFCTSIPSVPCYFPFFIFNLAHLCMSNSITMSWLYILSVSNWMAILFPFLANRLMSSLYIRILIISFNLINWIYLCIFWVKNSYGDSASPCNIDLRIFNSAIFLISCCSIHSPGAFDELYDFVGYLIHF